jgi:hypothetical protein
MVCNYIALKPKVTEEVMRAIGLHYYAKLWVENDGFLVSWLNTGRKASSFVVKLVLDDMKKTLRNL